MRPSEKRYQSSWRSLRCRKQSLKICLLFDLAQLSQCFIDDVLVDNDRDESGRSNGAAKDLYDELRHMFKAWSRPQRFAAFRVCGLLRY